MTEHRTRRSLIQEQTTSVGSFDTLSDKPEGLSELFDSLSEGEMPNFFLVMQALSDITEMVTLDTRPPCSLNPFCPTCD